MPTMATSVYEGSLVIVVALHGHAFPSDADWTEYVSVVRDVLAEQGPTGRARGIAITDGGGPTARQRALFVEASEGAKIIGAVVTASRLARGIGRALSWVHPEIKAFAPREGIRAL